MNSFKRKNIIIIAFLLLLSMVGVTWYLIDHPGRGNETKISMEKIIELSQKGDALTWGDFEQYQSVDVGSGLWIERFEIAGEPDYCLLVGGAMVGRYDKPMYIRLMKMENKRTGLIPDSEIVIDIREKNVEAFLKEQGVLP